MNSREDLEYERSRSPCESSRGEDSRHQFKRDETNADSIAAELTAFANSGGEPVRCWARTTAMSDRGWTQPTCAV